MKICEFTVHQLEAKLPESSRGLLSGRTPMEQAMAVLKSALEVVNQAGLNGKKLTELVIVQHHDMSRHPDDQVIEIHAKVTHRLKSL